MNWGLIILVGAGVSVEGGGGSVEGGGGGWLSDEG